MVSRFPFVFLFLLLCAVEASSQSSARVSGTVFDLDGAVVVGVEILAKDSDGNESRTVSDIRGWFEFVLPKGNYRILFVHPAFKKLVYENVELDSDKSKVLHITIELSEGLCPCGPAGVCGVTLYFIEAEPPVITKEIIKRPPTREF